MSFVLHLKLFISKCRRSGVTTAVRWSLKYISAHAKAMQWRLRGVGQLKRAGFHAVFADEGLVTIKLPKVTLMDAIAGSQVSLVANSTSFLERPSHEVLLRKIVFDLYELRILCRKKSIIDIGAWISDNALVWSRLIDSECAKVIAIDPSPNNIAFGRALSELNRVSNIIYYERVCSYREGVPLCFEGSLDHATFSECVTRSQPQMLSSTIDSTVPKAEHGSIGLFHIDVEGFEIDVLKGAVDVILASRPVILFEQHLDEQDYNSVFQFLLERAYSVYMINELLPGCRPDCRNFVAAPQELDLSSLLSKEYTGITHGRVTEAVDGPALIPVDGAPAV